jgi:uncharacterized protein
VTRIDTTFSSGGARCAAYVYRPEAAPEGGPAVPCVVMAHGFSATRDDGLPAFAERFAAAGLAVVLFDYRGFGASEGEPRQLLDIGGQLDDYAAAIAFARSLDGVDPDRIALWGSSFSGGHVLEAARRDGRIAAVVAQCPFTDGLAAMRMVPLENVVKLTGQAVADIAGSLAGRPPRTVPAVGPAGSVAIMTSPDAEPGFQAIVAEGSRWRNAVAARIGLRVGAYRPGRAAAHITCPLLVCICERDAVTPPEPAERAAAAAPRGEVRHYPIGHFEIYGGEPFERAVADQVEFLTRHLLR